MNPARRIAYLQALEVPVWVPKGQATSAPARAVDPTTAVQAPSGPPPVLSFSEGSSALLVICGDREEPAARLAVDIARAVREEPVWAWPAAGEGADIETAVNDQLFTRVVVLGEALAGRLFDGAPPERLGSARLIVAADLDRLRHDPLARRKLWALLCREGLARAT